MQRREDLGSLAISASPKLERSVTLPLLLLELSDELQKLLRHWFAHHRRVHGAHALTDELRRDSGKVRDGAVRRVRPREVLHVRELAACFRTLVRPFEGVLHNQTMALKIAAGLALDNTRWSILRRPSGSVDGERQEREFVPAAELIEPPCVVVCGFGACLAWQTLRWSDRPAREVRINVDCPDDSSVTLPYLRRFARTLTGSQEAGDAYVATLLESLVSHAIRLPHRHDPREMALYHLLLARLEFGRMTRTADRIGKRIRRQRRSGRASIRSARCRDRHFCSSPLKVSLRRRPQPSSRSARRDVESLLDIAGQEIAHQVATNVLIIEDELLIAMDLETIVGSLGHYGSGRRDDEGGGTRGR